MGLTHVAVKVSNRDSKDSFSANFLVDTGAADSMAPACELIKIGIKPNHKKPYELANGEIHRHDVAWVELSLMDETESKTEKASGVTAETVSVAKRNIAITAISH